MSTSRKRKAHLIRAACLLGVLALAGMGIECLVGALSLNDPRLTAPIFELRLSRALAAMLAGAACGASGALLQGLFRNPLADPGVLGTTAGATFGAQCLFILMMTGSSWLPGWIRPGIALPLGALVGAGLSLAVLLMVARFCRDAIAVLLVGFLVGSLCASGSTVLDAWSLEDMDLGHALMAYTLGGVAGKSMYQVQMAFPLIVGGLWGAIRLGRSLDVLSSGEEEAIAMGVDVRQTRRLSILWAGTLTAAMVILAGPLGFVGLIIPHALRPYIGPGHRLLIPFAALAGGAFTVWCDLVVRLVPSTAELPVSILTSIIGAPCFLIILLRGRKPWTT